MRRSFPPLGLVVLAACGGGGGSGFDAPGQADARGQADAPGQDASAADAPPGTPDAPASDGPGTPDASVIDGPGTPDAIPPDADPTLTATFRVTQEDFDPSPGAPIAGARIAVLGSAGVFTTDANGTAAVPLAPGSQVWVGRDPIGTSGDAAYGQLYFIGAVSPGDVVNLGALPRTGTPADGLLSIAYTPLAGATGVFGDDYLGECAMFSGGPAGEARYTTHDECDAPTRSLVITARDAGGNEVGYLTVPDVTPVPGAIDATAIAWQGGATYSVSYSGLPAMVYYADTHVGSLQSWHWIGVSSGIAGGAGSGNASGAQLPAAQRIAYAELDQSFTSPARSQYTSDPVPASGSWSVTGATLLPFITGPSISAATRTITWGTVDPGGVAPQLVTASFSNFDSATSTQFRWTIYLPGTATEIVIPDVPDAVTPHDLASNANVLPDTLLVHAEGSSFADLLTDYDLYRFDRFQNYRYKHGFRPTVRSRISGGGFYGVAP